MTIRQLSPITIDRSALEHWIVEYQCQDHSCYCANCFAMWLVTTKANDPVFQLFAANLIANRLAFNIASDIVSIEHNPIEVAE